MKNDNLFAALRAGFPADLGRTAIETALLGGIMVYAWMRMRAGDGVKNGFWVLFIMLGTLLVSHLLGLELLRYAVLCLGMVMAIVFQPELRRALREAKARFPEIVRSF